MGLKSRDTHVVSPDGVSGNTLFDDIEWNGVGFETWEKNSNAVNGPVAVAGIFLGRPNI